MLDATLATAAIDDGLTLSLRIENAGSTPVTLDFRTGQRAEFTAYPAAEVDSDADGEDADPVWRYGANRMFTQALGSETVAPGEAVGYEATWRRPPSGTYRIVGEAAATGRDVRAAAVVTVP
ncbi:MULTISPECIES: BsuPI-related putative proteinase inhibitor [Halorubrum]|jgi:hypothetical protein|uniref:Intracellular proteinase inhibitor BsuPI domain-containing protein n=1 Tax=Halorubrum tropicale TaxID=1765655 RepID=A0A0M9AQT1_9EURY|nr:MULTISPECIES: BsuPI-related putative proteinase inhibitor [Halorubrum]KOX96977.1 hypothetical protein AMR74_06000 [Halorubrum tropicale]TKX46105.1 hypothetical protein EXE50_02595 [Halorubrum sp. ARQ200]TKX50054.1 hypothetical protein EXE49_07730 [Halorubrum sp. ASP121]